MSYRKCKYRFCKTVLTDLDLPNKKYCSVKCKQAAYREREWNKKHKRT